MLLVFILNIPSVSVWFTYIPFHPFHHCLGYKFWWVCSNYAILYCPFLLIITFPCLYLFMLQIMSVFMQNVPRLYSFSLFVLFSSLFRLQILIVYILNVPCLYYFFLSLFYVTFPCLFISFFFLLILTVVVPSFTVCSCLR